MEIKTHYHLLFLLLLFFFEENCYYIFKTKRDVQLKNTKGKPNLLEDPIEINCFLTGRMLFISCNHTQANRERKGNNQTSYGILLEWDIIVFFFFIYKQWDI